METATTLLLHSLGCDGQMWRPQVDALRERVRVIAPDLCGHGSSAAPAGPYTLDDLGREVIAVLDREGIQRAHVCGISLGGAIAQWLAIARPDRVDRLVLANTASRIGSTAFWRERETMVRTQGVGSIADAVIGRFFGSGFRDRRPDVVRDFRAALLRTSAEGYAGCCAALGNADLTAEIGGIVAPTLVIGGSDDASTPPEQARALAAGIPGARLLILAAAHLSSVEQPHLFTDALRNHLLGPEML